MPGLILKLAPKERFVANGVVIENGDRRTRLNILTPDSNVLRMRDAIHPDQAKTPVSRVCYIVQLVLAGEADPVQAKLQILSGIEQLRAVFADPETADKLSQAARDVAQDKFYPALRALRAVLPAEERLIEVARRV